MCHIWCHWLQQIIFIFVLQTKIIDHWPLWVLIEDLSMTDHYECWLKTFQLLIIMSAVWGPFNDWSLWVLFEDSSMTDHYKCWLGTVQFLTVHILNFAENHGSWTTVSLITMIKNSVMKFLLFPVEEWMLVLGTCSQCLYPTLWTLPSYFLALFLVDNFQRYSYEIDHLHCFTTFILLYYCIF